MDKDQAHRVVESIGIKVPKAVVFKEMEESAEAVEKSSKAQSSQCLLSR